MSDLLSDLPTTMLVRVTAKLYLRKIGQSSLFIIKSHPTLISYYYFKVLMNLQFQSKQYTWIVFEKNTRKVM